MVGISFENAYVVISLSMWTFERVKLEISWPIVILCFKPVSRMGENELVIIDPSVIRIIICDIYVPGGKSRA